jgi:hypothetical protein
VLPIALVGSTGLSSRATESNIGLSYNSYNIYYRYTLITRKILLVSAVLFDAHIIETRQPTTHLPVRLLYLLRGRAALPPLLVDRCASGRTLVWDRAGLRRGASASSTRTATRTVSE